MGRGLGSPSSGPRRSLPAEPQGRGASQGPAQPDRAPALPTPHHPAPPSQGPRAVASESRPSLCSARRPAVGPTRPARRAPEGRPAVTCPIPQQHLVGSPPGSTERPQPRKTLGRLRSGLMRTPLLQLPPPQTPLPCWCSGRARAEPAPGGLCVAHHPCRPGPHAPTRLRASLELSAPDGVPPIPPAAAPQDAN